MEMRLLGDTGVRASRFGLGTMTFGREADERTSRAIFNRCREAGINLFDCADIYASGGSETILGKLIRHCRDQVLITTKGYFPLGGIGTTAENPLAQGSSRRHLSRAVEASLSRLKTDRIDIYFLHRFDEFTPLEETLRTLDDLVTAGKILYIGVSNFAAWQVTKAQGICEREGFNRIRFLQPMYNLVKRQAEVELLPMAQAERLAVLSYSPLGAGLLTGKYSEGRNPCDGRLHRDRLYQIRYGEPQAQETARRFHDFCRKNRYAPATLAVAWVAHHPGVTAPIIGASHPDQLTPALAAERFQMTSDLYEAVSKLSPEPPPATDRNEEKARR